MARSAGRMKAAICRQVDNRSKLSEDSRVRPPRRVRIGSGAEPPSLTLECGMNDEDLDLDYELEYRLTWRGAGGGKTGVVRQTRSAAAKEWRKQAARRSVDLTLQVRPVPPWNEPMETEDACELLGVEKPPPDWSRFSPEERAAFPYGHASRFPLLVEGTPEYDAFVERCRLAIEAGERLPEWSPDGRL